MSQNKTRCKICKRQFFEPYNGRFAICEQIAIYKNNKKLLQHIKNEHQDYLKENNISDSKLNNMMIKARTKFVVATLLSVFIGVPIFIMLLPLYLIYLGLEKLFNNIGHLW